ncbi:ABC transporter permease [Actinokineospora sp. NBRC 105648]|uniref:ABC transporter permease n=1 Tax=Actinokineospora sp. NBRC 105648 TaxID=3032206 RepID=UPI0024A44D5C|nr:ABC transporter permease [Actinokineospora sp. NBRC 105648]GLZ36643.1 ABC transporter permease [Actinokineospora sp. NBRC 105648]
MSTDTPTRTGGAVLPAPEETTSGLVQAVRAEWTKLRSVRSTWLIVAASLAMMLVVVMYYGSISALNDEAPQPVGNAPVAALLGVQVVLAMLSIQAVSNEYSTGSIRVSLLWVPVRGRLLLAKSVLMAGVGFALGVLLAVIGALVAWPLFDGHATAEVGELTRHVLLSGLYLALICVLSVGAAVALRYAAAALAAVFLLLLGIPGALLVSGVPFMVKLQGYLPTAAGQHAAKGHLEPFPPVVGLLLVVGWVAVAYVAGLLVLRARDA